MPQVIQPRVETGRDGDHRGYRPDYRPDYRPQYRPGYRGSYYAGYRPTYYRPYYTFRPRVRLGLSVWVGYPVVYPHAYVVPTYPYPYPPYSYGPSTSIYAAQAASGGLSFDITPPYAAVYIDGVYMGTVSQFSPDQPPLWLAAGRHYVEIREPGFELIGFYVDITPGQVIPYHGDLRSF